MDGNRRGSGDDQAGPNGPNVTQNPFDSAALLGKDMMLFLIQLSFLPARRYASAGYSDRNVSVCLSVCPSRAGIVSKRRKLAS